METKKKEKLRLEKNSGLYFVLGMALMLFLAYLALEWKTFDRQPDFVAQLNEPDFLPDEIIPVLQPPEPPKPKFVPPVIEEIPDDTTVEETFFEVPEPDQETEVIPVDSIEIPDNFDDDPIPFIVIEDAPIFPGCENTEDRKACFQEMMLKHVRKNFNYPEIAIDMGIEGRVNVVFTIQKDGSIGDVKMRGPHEILKEESARIISKLPKMQPGKQRGVPVKVPFSIPINFVLQ